MLVIRVLACLFICFLKVLMCSNNNIDRSLIQLLSLLCSMSFLLSKVYFFQYLDVLKPLNLLFLLAKYQCIFVLGSACESRQACGGVFALMSLYRIWVWASGRHLQWCEWSDRPQLFLKIKLYHLYPRFILTRQCLVREISLQ